MTREEEFSKIIDDILLTDDRFKGYAHFLASIYFAWSRDIPTACAGYGFIFFNPDFWDGLPKETQITVIAHEMWHLILKHMPRSEGKDHGTYNIAGDHVINILLGDAGFTFEGTEPYRDTKYRGQSTEDVYDDIYSKPPEERTQPKPGDLISKEKLKDLIKQEMEKVAAEGGEGNTPMTPEEQDKKIDEIIDSMSGIGGDALATIRLNKTHRKIIIEGMSYSRIFKAYLTDPLSKGKRTFTRPNRRMHSMKATPLRLPGRSPSRGKTNRLAHLVYALDISGSIRPWQAQQFHDSVRTIKELLNPLALTIMMFNTKVTYEKTYKDTERYGEVDVKGRGSTCLLDVYRKVKIIQPEALVILTDLRVSIPPKPTWDTIWLISGSAGTIPSNIYGELYTIPKDEH